MTTTNPARAINVLFHAMIAAEPSLAEMDQRELRLALSAFRRRLRFNLHLLGPPQPAGKPVAEAKP